MAEDNLVASVWAAQDRGELVDVQAAIRNGGVGRTRQEALAYYDAVQTIEDRKNEARERAAFLRWRAAHTAANSGDTSAPSELELAGQAQMLERAEEYRSRQYERNLLARSLGVRGRR